MHALHSALTTTTLIQYLVIAYSVLLAAKVALEVACLPALVAKHSEMVPITTLSCIQQNVCHLVTQASTDPITNAVLVTQPVQHVHHTLLAQLAKASTEGPIFSVGPTV